jgi:class 3 adenylate cyclase
VEYRRRRACVIVLDLCGYTEMLRQDEQAALRKRDEWRNVVEEIAEDLHVRLDGAAGDDVILWCDEPITARAFLGLLQEQSALPFSAALGEGDVLFNLRGRIEGLTLSEVSNLCEDVAAPGEVLEWGT